MSEATCTPDRPRLMVTQIALRPGETIGTCQECGVAFAGTVDRAAHVAQVWRAHESVCPGGARSGEVVRPFLPAAAEAMRRGQMSVAR